MRRPRGDSPCTTAAADDPRVDRDRPLENRRATSPQIRQTVVSPGPVRRLCRGLCPGGPYLSGHSPACPAPVHAPDRLRRAWTVMSGRVRGSPTGRPHAPSADTTGHPPASPAGFPTPDRRTPGDGCPGGRGGHRRADTTGRDCSSNPDMSGSARRMCPARRGGHGGRTRGGRTRGHTRTSSTRAPGHRAGHAPCPPPHVRGAAAPDVRPDRARMSGCVSGGGPVMGGGGEGVWTPAAHTPSLDREWTDVSACGTPPNGRVLACMRGRTRRPYNAVHGAAQEPRQPVDVDLDRLDRADAPIRETPVCRGALVS